MSHPLQSALLSIFGFVFMGACASSTMVHPSSSAANAGAPGTAMAPSLQPLASDFDPDRLGPGTPGGQDHAHHEGMTMPMDTAAPMAPPMPMNHAMPPTAPPSVPTPATTPGATESVLKAPAVYTCTMHSEVTSDKPGKCPKCGMKLVVKQTAPTRIP